MTTAPNNALDQDARAWCTVQLAGQPLVPAEARTAGPRGIITAALRRLTRLKRERGRLVYRRRPDESADAGDRGGH
jgi:hypothetical protein